MPKPARTSRVPRAPEALSTYQLNRSQSTFREQHIPSKRSESSIDSHFNQGSSTAASSSMGRYSLWGSDSTRFYDPKPATHRGLSSQPDSDNCHKIRPTKRSSAVFVNIERTNGGQAMPLSTLARKETAHGLRAHRSGPLGGRAGSQRSLQVEAGGKKLYKHQ